MNPRIRRSLYHLHLFVLHVGALIGLLNVDAHWLIASLLIYVLLQIFGGNIALHRYFSHHSFKTGALRERLLIVLGNLTCLGSSLSWVSTHRHHHAFADHPRDCHSPHHLSVAKILWGYWNPPDQTMHAVRNLKLLSWHLFFHHWYYLLHFSLILILAFVDWRLFVFFYAIPNLLVYYALYSVVIFCHLAGYRNFETGDQSRNNWLVSVFTFGEGWHNNHHKHPEHYWHGEKWWEFDISGFIIRILLVKN